MSRAFVKEPDGGEAFEELPERPLSPHPNFVTREGLALIEAEIERLHAAQTEAQAADDRGALARAARDLRYWTARRAAAQLVPPAASPGEVRFGANVTLLRDDGTRHRFRIVGEDEADPAHGTLSYVAPLARGLMGRQVGDRVRMGNAEAEIVEIN